MSIDLSSIIPQRQEPYPFNEDQEAFLKDLETTEAPQAFGWLEKDGGFCCLGRACVIFGADRTEGVGKVALFRVGESGSYKTLPRSLAYRLRMRGTLGELGRPARLAGVEHRTLASLNDTPDPEFKPGEKHLYTFKDIAAYIRHDPWNVFYGPDEIPADGIAF
jgi:hypothetical protein